jgi:hypothetical protein
MVVADHDDKPNQTFVKSKMDISMRMRDRGWHRHRAPFDFAQGEVNRGLAQTAMPGPMILSLSVVEGRAMVVLSF